LFKELQENEVEQLWLHIRYTNIENIYIIHIFPTQPWLLGNFCLLANLSWIPL